MGVGPSVGDFLHHVDDEGLTKLVAEAYRLDPQRMETVFSQAKKRCLGAPDDAAPSDGGKAADPAARLSSGSSLAVEPQSSLAEVSSSSITFEPIPQAPAAVAHSQADVQTVSQGDSTRRDAVQDPMNALWDFEGHQLRELQPASMNPYSLAQQSLHSGDSSGDIPTGTVAPEVDEDGNAILFGSCGRDKRYARCAVCYFRGLRCNTGHYCACCQRPVCIRPRKYPGEEHPKICWNVLHMDKGMMQRVEKKKKRKLQVMSVVPMGGSSSSLLPSSVTSSGAARSLEDDHGHDQREQSAQMPTLTSDAHEYGDAVVLNPDPRRQLTDSLSSTSVAL